MKQLTRFLITAAFSIGLATLPLRGAIACSDGYAADSFGNCWPVVDTRRIDPTPQIRRGAALLQAIVKGDASEVKRATGDLLINSPSCVLCRQIQQHVLPNVPDDAVKRAVGQGFLVFMTTGEPVLVILAAGAELAREQPIPQTAPPAPPAPAARHQQAYATNAECMASGPNGTVIAGWRKPASLTSSNGQVFEYPRIDLLPGDRISITAPLCPNWNDPNSGGRALTSATIEFLQVSQFASTDPTTLIWFISGKLVEGGAHSALAR